jgi:hypothetical protein
MGKCWGNNTDAPLQDCMSRSSPGGIASCQMRGNTASHVLRGFLAMYNFITLVIPSWIDNGREPLVQGVCEEKTYREKENSS